ncbi:MAG: CPBP family glutamic-type intramembrane protease [Cyanobacteria bacterium P01_D01_bin.71]
MLNVAVRLVRSFFVSLSVALVGMVLLALLAIAAFALVYGRRSGFLRLRFKVAQPVKMTLNLIKLFLFPALVEELIFRVMLLPHPTEKLPTGRWLAWAALSVGLFVIYHVIFSWVRPQARAVLSDRRFLVIVTWVGLILAVLYGLTGSLLAVTVVHWVVVASWLYGFGGLERLQGRVPDGAT